MLSAATIALAQAVESAPPASAALAFSRLKALAGTWKGQAAMGMAPSAVNAPVRVSLRVTSGGDALLHEMVPDGRSDDPTNGADDPVTIFYLDGHRLLLTHYCDSGKNRPRMVGKVSRDGKTVNFDFLDVSGATKFGHMQRAVFTFVDADHHIEDWTYVSPDEKASQAHIELVRAK
jgi:hypothetical protein